MGVGEIMYRPILARFRGFRYQQQGRRLERAQTGFQLCACERADVLARCELILDNGFIYTVKGANGPVIWRGV